MIALIRGYGNAIDVPTKLAAVHRALGTGLAQDARVKDDYARLLDIGLRYLTVGLNGQAEEIEIEPLALESLRANPSNEKTERTEQSRAKRLARKFRDEKDVILARLTLDETPERIQTLRAIVEILDRMQQLGISAVADHIRPVPIPRVAKSGR